MISITKKVFIGYKRVDDDEIAQYYQEGHCVSSDSKPTTTEFGNGSTLIEMDTGKIYMLDRSADTWREF